jgi:hypothetical protein
LVKAFRSFRFNPQVYASFKELASQNGYTVTGAFEKFMFSAAKYGLDFPSAKTDVVEAEARIMLDWLKHGQYWFRINTKEEINISGRLLQLLPNIANADLKVEIEEALKKKL